MCRAVMACCCISWREYTEKWNFNKGLRAAWLVILCPLINSYILHDFTCGFNCITIKANCNFLLSLHVVELQLTERNKFHLHTDWDWNRLSFTCMPDSANKQDKAIPMFWLASWAGWAYLALLVLVPFVPHEKDFVQNVNNILYCFKRFDNFID